MASAFPDLLRRGSFPSIVENIPEKVRKIQTELQEVKQRVERIERSPDRDSAKLRELDDSKYEVMKLKQQLKEILAELKTKDDQIKNLTDKSEKDEREIAQLQEQVKELQRKLEEREQQIERLQEELHITRRELQDYKQHNDQKVDDLSAKLEQLTTFMSRNFLNVQATDSSDPASVRGPAGQRFPQEHQEPPPQQPQPQPQQRPQQPQQPSQQGRQQSQPGRSQSFQPASGGHVGRRDQPIRTSLNTAHSPAGEGAGLEGPGGTPAPTPRQPRTGTFEIKGPSDNPHGRFLPGK